MKIKQTRGFEVQVLIISFLVIAICEIFFLVDVFADFFRIDIDNLWVDHQSIEIVSTLALLFALFVIGMQIRWLLQEHRIAQDTVQVASGELLDVIYRKFNDWGLSPSEHEVALMLIKGFSAQEIADLRSTRPGTVKSQSSAIYQKAEVRGRNELIAYFVEDLLAGDRIIIQKDTV